MRITKARKPSGFFLKKKPHFTTLRKDPLTLVPLRQVKTSVLIS